MHLRPHEQHNFIAVLEPVATGNQVPVRLWPRAKRRAPIWLLSAARCQVELAQLSSMLNTLFSVKWMCDEVRHPILMMRSRNRAS